MSYVELCVNWTILQEDLRDFTNNYLANSLINSRALIYGIYLVNMFHHNYIVSPKSCTRMCVIICFLYKLSKIILNLCPVHTALKIIENEAFFLRLALASTLSRHDNVASRKRSSHKTTSFPGPFPWLREKALVTRLHTRGIWKYRPALHLSVHRKHFRK